MAMCHHENIGDGNCWRLVVLVIDADFSQNVHNRESSPKTAGDRSESPAPSLHLNIPNLEVETDQGGLKTKTKLISPLASPNNSRVALKIDDNHTGKILYWLVVLEAGMYTYLVYYVRDSVLAM